MLQISVINESTALKDADIHAMIPALSQQWNQDLRSFWGIEQAYFTFLPHGHAPPSGAWWLVYLDDSTQADALAYHDLTNEGMPVAKVFVRSVLADNASLSVAASHELCEMAVDPWLNGAYQDPHGTFWAAEVCDPVEDDHYGYPIGGVLVSDFVTPGWFGHEHAKGWLDFKGHAKSAFSVLSGGYAQRYDPAKGWQQVNGEFARPMRKEEPTPGSRRERRARQTKSPAKNSAVRWGHRP